MQSTPYRPIAIDLFAGVGGLALGFEQAGFDVVVSVEYDPVHAAVHAYNFPHTNVICADLLTFPARALQQAVKEGIQRHNRNINDWDEEVDVIVGGPPCQGFSTMGKRLIDDERNQLVFQFYRIISEVRPRYFIMENVPGMRSGGHNSILNQLIELFQATNYHITYPIRILNASHYGVPQDRQRLFLMGSRGDMPHLVYPEALFRPVPKRNRGNNVSNSSQSMLIKNNELPVGPTVGDALNDIPNLDNFQELLYNDAVKLSEEQLQEMEARCSFYARQMRGLEIDPTDFSYSRKWDRSFLTSSFRTEHTQISIDRFAKTLQGETEPISHFYRLDEAGLSNTLRAGTGSERGAYTSARPIHPTFNRVISVREAARLHSFPDWFRLHSTKWHGFREIGNSVPPLLGRAVARAVIEGLGVQPTHPECIIELKNPQLLTFNMSSAAEYFGAIPQSLPKQRERKSQIHIESEDNMAGTRSGKSTNRYVQIIEQLFLENYVEGMREVPFARTDIERIAKMLGIDTPKNIGDLIYTFRYRGSLPESIRKKAPEGEDWIIRGTGRSTYSFVATVPLTITPAIGKAEIKIIDATPGIITRYALNDEQALLAILRYNRLIDIFTGVTCYSLQNHLRTTTGGIQVETDEIYVGVNKQGVHFIFPVQAKGGNDIQSIVQIEQDIKMCNEKFPDLVCRSIAAQFMEANLIALFELIATDEGIKVVEEKHYRLTPSDELSTDEVRQYQERHED